MNRIVAQCGLLQKLTLNNTVVTTNFLQNKLEIRKFHAMLFIFLHETEMVVIYIEVTFT